MKKLEKILALAVLVAAVYRYFYGVGSDVILMFVMNVSAIFYFFFSFALFNNIKSNEILKLAAYKNISRKKILLSVFVGIAISLSITGLYFRIQDFPGAILILYFSLLITVILSVLTLYKNYKTEGNFYYSLFIRLGIVALLLISILKIPDDKFLAWQYPDNPEYVNIVLKAEKEPDNDSLWNEVMIQHKAIIMQRANSTNDSKEKE